MCESDWYATTSLVSPIYKILVFQARCDIYNIVHVFFLCKKYGTYLVA